MYIRKVTNNNEELLCNGENEMSLISVDESANKSDNIFPCVTVSTCLMGVVRSNDPKKEVIAETSWGCSYQSK